MFSLNADQQAAVQSLPHAPVGALTGLAGCGKTVSAMALVAALRDVGRAPILCAPTHKAAGVLRQKSGAEVSTIHSLLKLVPVPNYEGGRVLRQQGTPDIAPGSTVVCDEASMLDEIMLGYLSEIMLDNVNVVLIGDHAQLPPVGRTEPVFLEWLAEKEGEVHKLTKIMRTADDNPLPFIAAEWRPGGNMVWPREDRVGASGGYMRVSRPTAMERFVTDAAAHYRAAKGSDAANPWLAYTNAAVHHAGQKARVAIHGEGADQVPYIEGETMSLCSPLMGESGTIVLPVSAVVKIVSDPMIADITIKDAGTWQAYQMQVRAEASNETSEVLAMPFTARNDMLNRLADRAKGMAYNSDKQAAWDLFYQMENMVVDMRTVYASTVHRSQGSGYHTVYIDRSDMSNMNARPIIAPLTYVALTRATSLAVGAV